MKYNSLRIKNSLFYPLYNFICKHPYKPCESDFAGLFAPNTNNAYFRNTIWLIHLSFVVLQADFIKGNNAKERH